MSVSDDAELRALTAICEALEPLSRGAAGRVLKWAEERYVNEYIPMADVEWFSKFVQGLNEESRRLGVSPQTLWRVASNLTDAAATTSDRAPAIAPASPAGGDPGTGETPR